jgi:quinol monooxygenase YgiN
MNMTQPITLVFDTTANPGKLSEVKAAATKLVNDVKANEPAVAAYNLFCDDASGRVCFLDAYSSSEALLKHLARPPVESALNTINANCAPPKITILGTISPEARQAVSKLGAKVVAPVAGFSRPLVAPTA